jgi:hypothetical protein
MTDTHRAPDHRPPRGAELSRLVEETGELRFVRHRSSGTVHVIVPGEQPWGRTDLRSLPDVEPDPALNLLFGATLTICGYLAREHRDGIGRGDPIVETFADALLCRSCHRLLGALADRAFEHPQTADSEETP